MTIRTSKTIALVVLAALVGTLSGCKHFCRPQPGCAAVCESNLKAGYATITCQPLEMDFTNDQTEVEFEVAATGRAPIYFQWYFVAPDSAAQPLEEIKEGHRQVIGPTTPRLTIQHPSLEDCGRYYCEIVSSDCSGGLSRTQTRQASLGFTPTTRMLMVGSSPVQSVPPSGTAGSTPQPNCAQPPVAVCSWVQFDNNKSGYPLAQKRHYFDAALTNTQTRAGSPLSTAQYQIMALDITGSARAMCAKLETNRWYLDGLTGHT